MKTEKQVKAELKKTMKRYVQVQKDFERYDNHDDMEYLAILDAEIATLQWVLS